MNCSRSSFPDVSAAEGHVDFDVTAFDDDGEGEVDDSILF